MTQEEFHKRYQYNSNSDCLGEGGFGKVYKAYDTHRDRFVAIKMAEVRPHLEEVRLRKEVEIISKLPSHPNIAYYEECYTFSTFAGEYDFGVLQYYDEGNLQQLVADKQLSLEQKDSILRQILEGIAFLHSQGIIHRDLKPQNILIVNRKGEYIPKITDFGISKKLDVNKSTFFTNSLAGAGTISFASPEQLLGKTIRKNTDLWSFGVIACWIFNGKIPFNTGNQSVTSEAGRIELFKQITSGVTSSEIQQLPSVWQKIVKQCIIVDSDKRIGGAVKCLEILSSESVDVNKKITTDIEEKTDIVVPTIDTVTSKTGHNTFISRRKKSPWKKVLVYCLTFLFLVFFAFFIYTMNRGDVYANIKPFSNGVSALPKNTSTFSKLWNIIFGETNLSLRDDFNEKYEIVNKEFSVITKEKYEDIKEFSEGLAAVKRNGKWGFIDNRGFEKINCQYDRVENFSEELAVVENNNKWGYINKNGSEVIHCEYESTEGLSLEHPGNFSDGLAAVIKNQYYGFIDKVGVLIIPYKYRYAGSFSNDAAKVQMREGNNFAPEKDSEGTPLEYGVGFIDKRGNEIIPPTYYNGLDFSEELAAVRNREYWGFVNKQGIEVIEFKYEAVSSFSEGIARIKTNKKWGIIDKNGNMVASPQYDYISDYSEGLARVNIGNRYGFIDINGSVAIPLSYEWAGNFSEGLCVVTLNGKDGFIDSKGSVIIPFEYTMADGFSEGIANVRKDFRVLFINENNECLKWYFIWNLNWSILWMRR